jgi:metal-dependent amidase/aminoacylase/carboxypeptidase family protein
MLQQEIKQLANKIYSTVVENRRHLHRYPELSFDEHETAAFVKARLNEMGITWQAMANTGVLGIIKGSNCRMK